MSDTPETEIAKLRAIFPKILEALQSGCCSADCSLEFLSSIPKEVELVRKKLECERDGWKAKFIQQNKDLGCEMMDPDGTIWDYAKKLQAKLDEARQQRDNLERERDEWKAEAERLKNACDKWSASEMRLQSTGNIETSDIINGLLHTAEDHPCCKGTILAAANLLLEYSKS